MFRNWYARRMYDWETRLTTRDENRVVRPLDPFRQSPTGGAVVTP